MDDVANAAAGQMAYIGLSLAGQLLLVSVIVALVACASTQ